MTYSTPRIFRHFIGFTLLWLLYAGLFVSFIPVRYETTAVVSLPSTAPVPDNVLSDNDITEIIAAHDLMNRWDYNPEIRNMRPKLNQVLDYIAGEPFRAYLHIHDNIRTATRITTSTDDETTHVAITYRTRHPYMAEHMANRIATHINTTLQNTSSTVTKAIRPDMNAMSSPNLRNSFYGMLLFSLLMSMLCVVYLAMQHYYLKPEGRV